MLRVIVPTRPVLPVLPPLVERTFPFRSTAFTRLMLAPAGVLPLSVVSIVVFAVKKTLFNVTSPTRPVPLATPVPRVRMNPANFVALLVPTMVLTPSSNRVTSVSEFPKVISPVFRNVVCPSMALTLPVMETPKLSAPVVSAVVTVRLLLKAMVVLVSCRVRVATLTGPVNVVASDWTTVRVLIPVTDVA